MNFEEYENAGRARYERLARAVELILVQALAASERLSSTPQTESRAKESVSLGRKLEDRGLESSSAIENDIKDLAGCRVIFYTDTDLERFRQSDVWEKSFEVDWKSSKTHFPPSDDASVDDLYQGIHYVVRLNADLVKLAEYADLAGLRCEVQLQTIFNHAWSETSHDVLYKYRSVPGFGAKQYHALKKRFARIMRDHLMPASYEMQKIQDDAERLRAGQAVFDSEPLRKLAAARDNNERVDILKDIKTYLLPGLDDLSLYLREIRSAVVSAIEASRTAPIVARESSLGAYRGEKSSDVLNAGLEILQPLQYGRVEESFRTYLRLWEGTAETDDRKAIDRSIERIAKYSIPVWEQVGAGVQVALTEELRGLGAQQRARLRPIVLNVCSAALGTEMNHSEATSFDTITFSRGTVGAHSTLVAARQNAIELGVEMLEASSTSDEWREAWRCLWEGASGISRTGDAALATLQLDLIRELCRAVTQRRSLIPYDILQEIEEDLYWAHRRLGKRRDDAESASEPLGAESAAARAALLECRDQLNLDERYVTYKTLVGFRTVFTEEWDGEIEISDKEARREERIAAYAAQVEPANREYWLAVAVQCAETKSDDLATFPPLTKFFKKISTAQPEVALYILLSGGRPLEGFAPSFLPTLLGTSARPEALAAMRSWVPERSAGPLGRTLLLCDEPFPDIISRAGAHVVTEKDRAGCLEIARAALKHGNSENGLWTSVLVPVVNVLTEAGDGAFASSPFFSDAVEKKLGALAEAAAKAVLDNFVCCPKIGYGEQTKLAHLIDNHDELVWVMFEARVQAAGSKTWEDRYEAVPAHWHGLEKRLRADVVRVYRRVSSWAEGRERLGNWDKAEFIANLYQDCDDSFVKGLIEIIRMEGAGAVPFACEVLQHFDGNEQVDAICQAMVEAVPEDYDQLHHIRHVIEATGTTSGEFGRAQAMESKALRLQGWLDHENSKVRKFAGDLIEDLKKISIHERRRGTASRERRKRDFDDPE